MAAIIPELPSSLPDLAETIEWFCVSHCPDSGSVHSTYSLSLNTIYLGSCSSICNMKVVASSEECITCPGAPHFPTALELFNDVFQLFVWFSCLQIHYVGKILNESNVSSCLQKTLMLMLFCCTSFKVSFGQNVWLLD